MAISQAIRNRIKTIGDRNTPDDIERALFTQGIKGIPNDDTNGIVQRYLQAQGFATTKQYARGIKYLTSDDFDVFILPRSIAVFIIMFNLARYPRIIDPIALEDN